MIKKILTLFVFLTFCYLTIGILLVENNDGFSVLRSQSQINHNSSSSTSDDESLVLTYESKKVDCSWLEAEYERIINWNNTEEKNKVTSEGVLMTILMIVTAPFQLLESLLSQKVIYDFSDDPDDIAISAKKKGCQNLLERMNKDHAKGTYPQPLQQ